MGRSSHTIQITLWFTLALGIVLTCGASAKTWTIDPAGALRTVKEGLARCSNGDTLRILPGMYREGNIIVQKSVVLLGIHYPVFDGEHRYEVFTIAAPDVSIIGLKIIDTGSGSINDVAAIKGLQSKRLRIFNNQFENTFFGIYLSNVSDAVVENNVLHSNPESQDIGNGIHAWKCDSLTIRNNTVSGHRDGIYFEFVTRSLVEGNKSFGNMRYGLHFMFSHNDTYHSNTFRNNGAGVAVMYTKGVTMIGNHFEDNLGAGSYGLLLKDIRDSFVEQNTFSANTIGIYMEGSSRCLFAKNIFHENGWALKIQANCDGNVFKSNNFLANTFDVATNGTLVLNSFDHNYWDKYEGYDLNKDGVGDVPFHPVSMYSMVVDKMPSAVMLWRSLLVYMLDKTEKVVPSVTPENLKDDSPHIKRYDYRF